MNELERLWREGWCELLMPRVAWNEAVSGRGKARDDREKKASSYFWVDLVSLEGRDRYYEVIESMLFPGGAKKDNQKNDIMILLAAREMRYPLVTNDGDSKSQPNGMLGKKHELKDALGITVIRDCEAVAKVTQFKVDQSLS